MAINLSDNIKVNAPKPVEDKYLNITVPYISISEVNTCIPEGERYPGLTVNVNGFEFWYKNGVLDTDLIIKVNITGATNGLSVIDNKVVLGGDLISGTTINGQLIFNDGIIISSTPNPELITGHTKGKIYYDNEYQTISINLNDSVNLQLGQEDLRYVYNPSLINTIENGAVVYSNGIYDGGGVTAAVTTVGLAIATGVTSASVLGLATEDILPQSYGFITSRGHINDLNTLTSQEYSGMTVGDMLYLSEIVPGGVTKFKPNSPNIIVSLGRLISKHQTHGKIFVQIFENLRLDDLSDVDTPNPSLDQILKWNGVKWVNGNPTTSSIGAGVTFYNATPIINSRTLPAGINSTGSIGNGVFVANLSKTPVTTGTTQTVTGVANNDTRAVAAWLYPTALGKTVIESGNWSFESYLSVDSVSAGNTYSTRQIYQSTPLSGSTVSITGSGLGRTATITSNQFSGVYFSASTNNLNSSWLYTPSGIFQISGKTSNNVVKIVTPSSYINETGVSGATWNKLFGVTTPALTTVHTKYEIITTQPSFNIATTDSLGLIGFITTTASSDRIVTLSYNGTSQASYFMSPLVSAHNELAGLQGGSGDERYHISLNKYNLLENTSGVNTGDETKSTIENKLTGEILTHWHPYSGITGKPNLTLQSDFVTHTGDSSIHFTQAAININENQVTNLVTDLQNRSLTGHTHDYTGTTITNKPIFVGSGTTIVSKVGNEYRVYSTSDISNAANGLSKVGSSVVLGGALTGNTSLTGNYSLNICSGAKLNTTCGYQISGVTFFDATRNSLSNVRIGQNALINNSTGLCNIAIGQYSLSGNTTGCKNIGIGICSLSNNVSGNNNVGLGICSLSNNVSGNNNVGLGGCTLYSNSVGLANVAIGTSVLKNNVNGCFNTGVGYLSMCQNVSGNYNVGVGTYSLQCNLSGNNNIAIGICSLRCNTSGNTNIGIGNNSGYLNLTGSSNIAIGDKALYSNLVSNNIAIGNCSLSGNTTGCNNVSVGFQTLLRNTTGCRNTAIGYQTMCSNTIGYQNAAIGNGALSANISGMGNVAVGQFSLQFNCIGNRNIAVGMGALSNSKLDNNIGVGYRSLYNSTGSTNIAIGNCAGYNETGSGKLYIGSGSTSLIMGDMTTPNECIILPYLKLRCTPQVGSISDSILVWNSTDKLIKTISGAALGDKNNFYSTSAVTTNAILNTGSSYVLLINSPTAAVTITLPATPITGEAFKFKDVSGQALTYNITISGNGRNIDGFSTALINTDYGAMELVYNLGLNAWYTLAFIN